LRQENQHTAFDKINDKWDRIGLLGRKSSESNNLEKQNSDLDKETKIKKDKKRRKQSFQ
jgi:hypothetical protein